MYRANFRDSSSVSDLYFLSANGETKPFFVRERRGEAGLSIVRPRRSRRLALDAISYNFRSLSLKTLACFIVIAADEAACPTLLVNSLDTYF